jgi:FkbM family methyltransferase
MNAILVDCGANIGGVLEKLSDRFASRRIFAFEPNPLLIPRLSESARLPGRTVELLQQAVWNRDERRDFYLGHHESSTLLEGKVVPPIYDRQIDYGHPISVQCIDFSRWLASLGAEPQSIVVKMDIEGAEYPVLEHLLEQGTVHFISKLLVEWHYDRFPGMFRRRHDRLLAALSQQVEIEPWDS